MGRAAHRAAQLLVGALSSTHARKPPTKKDEGAAKEEKVRAMHDRELTPRGFDVKDCC